MAEIEGELRRCGQWESTPPSAQALASSLPFCCDTLRFTQWLQWVFLPHTRALAESGRPMPRASGIRPMAEEALRGCPWETLPLLKLLGEFDRMILLRVRNSAANECK
jgi:uncharacterized protein YqcC (DUF446 family)